MFNIACVNKNSPQPQNNRVVLTYAYLLLIYWSLSHALSIQFTPQNRQFITPLMLGVPNLLSGQPKQPRKYPSQSKLPHHKTILKINRVFFQSYINIAFHTLHKVSKVHHSFNSLYVVNSSKGSKVVNISKLSNVWSRVSTYLYSLYLYNINSLFFGTSFFRQEVLSLNWLQLSNTVTNYRHSNLLLTTSTSNNNSTNPLIYKLLKLAGITNAVILDFNYHEQTVTALRKLSVFTLALTPTTYDASAVDLALPTSVDSVFTQLFFLKLVVKLRRTVEHDNNSFHKKLWLNTSLRN